MSMQIYKSFRKPLAETYRGKAQTATFTFSLGPDQFDFINKWFENNYVRECENSISQKSPGDALLTMDLRRDTSPTWTTEYECTIVSTDKTGHPLPWLAILGLLAVAMVVVWLVVRPLLKSVQDLIWGPSGDDDNSGGIPWLLVGGVVIAALLATRGTQRTVRPDKNVARRINTNERSV